MDGDGMKTEVDSTLNEDNSCFICLQQVSEINEEQFNSLNFFFNYLKISEVKEAFVCEEREEKLAKFVNLCKVLETIRDEMDQVLGFVEMEILKSKEFEFKASAVFSSFRECVMKRCEEEKADLSRRKWIDKQDDIISSVGSSSNLIKREAVKTEILEEGDGKRKSSKKIKRSNFKKGSGLHKKVESFKSCSQIADDHLDFNVANSSRRPRDVNLSDKFKAVTENGERIMECLVCGKKFNCRGAIRRHIRVVHEEKKFNCKICGYKTSLIFKFKQHTKRMHKSEEIEMVECELCKKQIKSIYMYMHIRNNHGPKKLVCEICGYATVNKASLEAHIERNHKDDNNVECEFCKKKVKSVYHNTHIRMVHGQKKFVCEVCGYATVSKAKLDEHVEVNHKVKKTVECEFCKEQVNSTAY